jgi:uncharacterized protein
MKFSEDYGNSQYALTGYDDHYIQVNQTRYEHSLIITHDTLVTDWTPDSPEELMHQDVMQGLIKLQSEIVILGTGRRIHFPPPELMALFSQHQVGIEVLDSASACRTFNILLSEGRNVAAGLLLPGSE